MSTDVPCIKFCFYAGFPKTKWGNPSEPVRLALRVKLKDFIDLLCNWKRLRCRKRSYFSWKSHHVFFPSAILSLFTTSVCRLDGSPTGLIWSNSVWSAPHVYVNRGLSEITQKHSISRCVLRPSSAEIFLEGGRWGKIFLIYECEDSSFQEDTMRI